MNGQRLKEILQDHGITGRDLAKLLKRHERGVYGWYTKPFVKKKVIEKIIAVTKLDSEIFYPLEHQVNEPDLLYKSLAKQHHGNNIKALMEQKEITLNNFARRMKKTRQTINNWFKESEWPEGRLLEAAQKLGVPVEEFKGQKESIKTPADKDILQKLHALEIAVNTNNELLRKLIAKGKG